jgi:signal transduction histidine kinase
VLPYAVDALREAGRPAPEEGSVRGDALTEPEAGDRTGWVWALLFTSTLAAPTAATVLDDDLSGWTRLTALGTAVLLLTWFLVVLGPRGAGWHDRRRVLLFWAGAAALVAVLAGLSPVYVLVLYGLIPLLFTTLGWSGLVGVVGLAALVGWRAQVWDDGAEAALGLLTVVCLALGIAAVLDAVEQQSSRRRDALAALTATRAELAETARRAGVLEERERLARDLHDTVAQGLTSVVTHLEAAEQAWEQRPGDARGHLSVARDAARDGLGDARRAVAALRPDLLEGRTLHQALERRADRWSAATGVVAVVETTGEPVPLHPDAETALLRAAEEALANAAKHARATRVTLTLSWLGDAVALDVDDDGVGFADVPAPREHSGFGLPGLRERLAAVGGRLEVESAPGEGTTLMAQVPT